MTRARFAVCLFLMLYMTCIKVYASQTQEWEENGKFRQVTDSWETIDEFLQKQNGTGASFSFSDLAKALMEGEGRLAGQMLLEAAKKGVLGEIKNGWHLAGQLLAIGTVGAVFSSFTRIFSGSQTAETGFFLTYLLAFTVLASCFFESIKIAAEALEKQVTFMRLLLPSYAMAVAWSGASLSAAAWYEALLFLIGVVQWLYCSLLLPAVRVYVLLVMAGNLMREDMLSKMTGLLRGGLQWGTRSLIGLVLGFQLLQGMVLPYADSVKSSGLRHLLQAIPGIGQGTEAAVKVVLGSGVLIKNTMGAAAAAVLLFISLTPVVKLGILFIFCRGAAAVLEPVADARLVGCISGVADGQRIVLGLVVSGMLLFVVALALICGGTNVSYMAV